MSKKQDTTGKINVLIIGSGGREHALGWKIKQSARCGKIYFAPGNGGTAGIGTNLPMVVDKVDTKTVDEIDYFSRHNQIGLIVIGPEDPLSQGLADRLSKVQATGASGKPEGSRRLVFGPVQAAARLEGDKAFAKQLMRGAAIPTADARVFSDYEAAQSYINERETPVVVKAAGLAKGKGVIVCDNQAQALEGLKLCMIDKAFGDAGDTVLIEERLVGQEISILALVDGRTIYVLDPSQDHKQAGEGDTGPNTGGMGAYCPTPLVDEALMDQIQREVLVPTIDALRRDGVVFQGVLYAGLMLTAGGPKVLEFNCRFGDPETQPLMMRLKGDLLELMLATCHGRLDEIDLSWDHRCCCCVVMASAGYPGSYDKGKPITGIAQAEAQGDVKVFHAGTTMKGQELLTAGGRVLNVCAMGKDLAAAQQKANAACGAISFEGAWFRRDIGYRVMKQRV